MTAEQTADQIRPRGPTPEIVAWSRPYSHANSSRSSRAPGRGMRVASRQAALGRRPQSWKPRDHELVGPVAVRDPDPEVDEVNLELLPTASGKSAQLPLLSPTSRDDPIPGRWRQLEPYRSQGFGRDPHVDDEIIRARFAPKFDLPVCALGDLRDTVPPPHLWPLLLRAEHGYRRFVRRG